MKLLIPLIFMVLIASHKSHGQAYAEIADRLTGLIEREQYQKAVKTCDTLLSILRRSFTDTSQSYAMNLSIKAFCLGELGQYEKAALLYEEATGKLKKLHKEDDYYLLMLSKQLVLMEKLGWYESRRRVRGGGPYAEAIQWRYVHSLYAAVK